MTLIHKLYTISKAIAHTDKTIEMAGDGLQKKAHIYSLSLNRNENDLVSK